MRRDILSIIIGLQLFLAIFVVVDLSFDVVPTARGATIYVPNDYPTIQEAVDAANPWDTVYVYSGTYNETVVVDKTINLVGENRDTTIIDGGSCINVVYVNADSVEITGFTIIGDVDFIGAGIYLDNVQNCEIRNNVMSTTIEGSGILLDSSSGNIIESNNVSNYFEGVLLIQSSGNTVIGNTGFNNQFAIYLYSSNGNNINNNYAPNGNYFEITTFSSSGNTIFNNDVSSICLLGSDNNEVLNNNGRIFLQTSNINTISGNNASNSDDVGIDLWESNGNTITGNTFISNSLYGIYLWYSNANNITDNSASLNDEMGIFLDSSNGNNIIGNKISSNGRDGINLMYSNANNITENNASLNSEMGIKLYFSSSNTISSNEMIENGIYIIGDLLEHWNTHTIDTFNTINNRPIYYWKNQSGGIIPADAGEIILANCTNVIAENQGLMSGSVGIEFGFSSNNTILNTTISNEIYGVFSYFSDNDLITNSTISNCDSDITLYGNSHVVALNTTFNDGNVNFDPLSTLTVKWYLHVNVTDYLGNPVSNANVRIADNKNGQYNETFTTDTNGYLQWLPITEYVETSSGKTYYTPHRIVAWNDTLVGYAYPDPTIDQSKTINVVLHNGTLLDLEPGWNLLSLPRIQSDTNLPTVLQSVENRYDSAQWYNSTDNRDHWKHNHINKPTYINDLQALDHTKGFWLHVTDPEGTSLVVFGDELASAQNIPLHPGWNLVGYPSKTNKTRALALNTLTFGNEVDAIWTFNATMQQWEEVGPSDYFELGRGYWIHATQESVWEVPL